MNVSKILYPCVLSFACTMSMITVSVRAEEDDLHVDIAIVDEIAPESPESVVISDAVVIAELPSGQEAVDTRSVDTAIVDEVANESSVANEVVVVAANLPSKEVIHDSPVTIQEVLEQFFKEEFPARARGFIVDPGNIPDIAEIALANNLIVIPDPLRAQDIPVNISQFDTAIVDEVANESPENLLVQDAAIDATYVDAMYVDVDIVSEPVTEPSVANDVVVVANVPAQDDAVAIVNVTDNVVTDITYDTAAEKNKWVYVCQNFASEEKELAGFSSKAGTFLRDYASVISGTAVSIFVFMWGNEIVFNVKMMEKVLGQDLAKKLAGNPKVAMTTSALAGVAAGSIAYGLSNVIGRWLQAKPAMCETILKTYVLAWDKHKENTPQILWQMFDSLSQDVQVNNGVFTKINQDQARLIVENVLAAGLLATVV